MHRSNRLDPQARCAGRRKVLSPAVVAWAALAAGVSLALVVPGVARGAGTPPATATRPAPTDEELLQAYLPKEDLGATRFLREHPDADGRGILVAILDTGIDLDHPGLRVTPGGERKIVDVFDATDNGLIELPVAAAPDGGRLTGLTGRRLNVEGITTDGGRFRLGRIAAGEVFPRGLTNRLRETRREGRQRGIDAWEAAVAREEAGTEGGAEGDSAAVRGDRARTYRQVRRAADREYVDSGPDFDLIAYREQGVWRVRIDVDEDGLLTEESPLRIYREAGDLAIFPPPASFSVALASIAEDGARCSLVFDEGGHGSHVAGIVGAYYGPDDPLNGLAPGVRFLSVRIGNSRLGGSTSHNSIAKGISWAIEQGASAANISFGGSTHFQDGREILSRYLNEVVQNHGIFITMSAGNEGPALTTIGAAGTARRVFTLGAAISPLTMLTSYGGLTRPELPDGIRMFNFSSRGPLANGSPGIDFISPGAAVSTLPTWHLTRGENWNGTSMAAPQACGCIALLLSAARQDGLPVSPARVDRALRATARPLPGISFVEQGAGLIAVPEAYAALQELARSFPIELPAADATGTFDDSTAVAAVGVPATRDPVTFWRPSVENATGTGEGFYERNELHTAPYWKEWYIAPDLPEKGANPLRTRFQRVVKLTSEVPWLSAPPQVTIPASGLWIRVLVDPTRMAPGLNTGRIRLRTLATADASGRLVNIASAPGTETELTATIIRPDDVTAPEWRWRRTVSLQPGDRNGAFLRVPDGATRMRLHLKETAAEPANSYSVAINALDLSLPVPALRDGRGCDLRRGEELVLYERVQGGTTLELAVFARWVNPGTGTLELTAEFDGVTGPPGSGSTAAFWGEKSGEARWGETPLLIPPGRDGVDLPLRSILREERVRVSASFHGRIEPLEIAWVAERDSVHPAALEGGIEPMLLLGRGWLRLDREESVTIDLNTPPELEDFLDDCFCRMYAPTGALVAAVNLSYGPFRLAAPKDAPASGWYELEFSVFGVGRSMVRDAAFVSPEVIRGDGAGRVAAFLDAAAARAAGADSSEWFTLPAGTARSLYLRAKGLPEGAVWAGSVTLHDGDDRPPLLRTGLRADTRPSPPSAEDSWRSTMAALEREADRISSLPPGAPAAAVARAIQGLDRADALQRAWRGDDPAGSDEWWSRLFRRVDLYSRHGLEKAVGGARPAPAGARPAPAGARSDGASRVEDARDEEAQREVTRLLGDAEKRIPENPANAEEARRTGRVALRRAAYQLTRNDTRAARKAFDRAERFDFGGDAPDAVKAELLRREGKPLEAVEPLRHARASDPWNPLLARREIELYLELGWCDLADERIEAWSGRFPREGAMLVDLVGKRAATKPASEARND